MTFRRQFLVGAVVGIGLLAAAWVTVGIAEISYGGDTPDGSWGAVVAGTFAFLGLGSCLFTVWRAFARLAFIQGGRLGGMMHDYFSDYPFWRWVLHVDQNGRDRDA